MGSQTKAALSVNPAIGPRKTPRRLFVQTPQTGRHLSFLFLLLVPHWAFGFNHHFVGAHLGDAGFFKRGAFEKRFEKQNLLLFQVYGRFFLSGLAVAIPR